MCGVTGLKDSVLLGGTQSPLGICGFGGKAEEVSSVQCFSPAIMSLTDAGTVLAERWI